MEWTFDEARQLAKEIGLEQYKVQLFSPSDPNPSWSDSQSFLIFGRLNGVYVTILDNNLADGKRGVTYVRFSLGNNFHVTEPLPEETVNLACAATKKLADRDDVKRIVAGGGLDVLKEKFWRTVIAAVTKAGGGGIIEFCRGSGELPGYGKFEGGRSSKATTELVCLKRNNFQFAELEVDLLYGDFATAAKEVVSKLKQKREEPKRKRRNTPLYERLNDLQAYPIVEDGKVVALADQNNEHLRTAELEELGLDPESLGVVEPHPEGADRGGYRPYCEASCEWS